MAGQSIVLNGSYDMNTATVITGSLDHNKAPERKMSLFELARAHGAVITNTQYGVKVIPAKGVLNAATAAACDALEETFKQNMAVSNVTLDVGYNGGTRRYIVTPGTPNIVRENAALEWADYQIDFYATEFGRDTSATPILTSAGVSSFPNTNSLTVAGTAPEQYLSISVTVTAATGLTSKYISLKNGTTGQQLTITRTWVVGDVLTIDCQPNSFSVKVNSVDVAYSGAFPIFSPGTHNLILDCNFTTATLTRLATYIKRYL